jgi:hypothetical protein
MEIRRVAIAGVICAIVLGAMPIRAAGPAEPSANVGLGTGSTLWIEGKSNLHEFEARTNASIVHVTRDPAQPAPTSAAELTAFVKASGVKSLDVEVPVTSLRSGKNGLDKNMWQDLKATEAPTIRFHLERYQLAPAGDTLGIQAEGTLGIAGKDRPVTLAARVTPDAAGLVLEGSQELRMTDYGIKPRTMMLGTLRVQDRVTVHYRFVLVPAGTGEKRTD